MNRNYLRGRAYEYALAKELRSNGWDVIRASGSHGKFDLVAIHQYTPHTVMLIQCKVARDHATAKRICSAFRENPPYKDPDFIQVMSVKVKGGERREAYV